VYTAKLQRVIRQAAPLTRNERKRVVARGPLVALVVSRTRHKEPSLLKQTSVVVLLVLVTAFTAFAGDRERTFRKNELQPMVVKAEAKYRSACGCALKISVTSGIRTHDDMRQARFIARDLADAIGNYCTDTESKQAMCAMRTLEIVRGNETSFRFEGSNGTATTDGISYVSFSMITREVDK